MPRMPRGPLDSTLAMVREPYRFISQECCRLGSDVFETHILMQRTVCMLGAEAAQLFYDEAKMTRVGAAPLRVQMTLFGKGGVQGLDGEAHRNRKAMFMSLVSPEGVARMVESFERAWDATAARWPQMRRVEVYPQFRQMLTRAVCAWAGVELREQEVAARTRQLSALFEGAGAVGPRHWWGRLERKRANRWAADVIREIRAGERQVGAHCAAAVIASHRDVNAKLLDEKTAAVELLNVLRPTVAVAVYLTLAMHALITDPQCRERLNRNADGYADDFVQEVRRFYPFFPSVAARVRQDFEWQGYQFPGGARAILDLYGTNHDPRIWGDPACFRPERFTGRTPAPFDLMPQGGGNHMVHHRCAGEAITLAVMKAATKRFASMKFEIPEQDLSLDIRRMPALPRSGVVICV